MDTDNTVNGRTPKIFPIFKIIALLLAIMLIACAVIMIIIEVGKENEPEIVTVSTLEKIINVSELSSYTAVYNGIAEVKNETNPDKVDYYVSYEANVDAGIDFEKIVISLNEEAKTIKVDIPEVYITDIEVRIESLDFIFYNDDANTSTVSQAAFKACEADAQYESENQEAIYDLAQKNAVNILTALLKPIVEQMDEEYALVIE